MHKNREQHKQEMYALIRNWESSGLAQLKFLKDSGISKSAFGYWRKRYLEEQQSSKPESGRLIPIKVVQTRNHLYKKDKAWRSFTPMACVCFARQG